MVSSSKFQPNAEGGASAVNPVVVTSTTGSHRLLKESTPISPTSYP